MVYCLLQDASELNATNLLTRESERSCVHRLRINYLWRAFNFHSTPKENFVYGWLWLCDCLQLKENKYVRLCKTAEAIDVEKQKQGDRMNQVLAIVDRLSQDYPHAQLALRRVAAAYGSRGPVGN
jgi:hypothetical protein